MLKSKIRKKIIKIRKNRNTNNVQIKFNNVYKLLNKITDLRKKIIGGYYPVNHEIGDLDILRQFEKKKITISLPAIKNNYRFKKFFELFKSLDIIRNLDSSVESWDYKKLNETDRIAGYIEKRFQNYDFS